MRTDAIRRLNITATSSGLDETTGKLGALGRAQTTVAKTAEGMAVATESSARRQLSSARAYESVKQAADPLYKAQVRQQEMQMKVQRALDQGVISNTEFAKSSAMVASLFGKSSNAANDNGKAIGLNAFEMKNLGFQLNDVGTMLASGSSPFQVLATQGGQIYQILAGANGGVTGALKDMATRAMAFLGPVGLMGAGLSAVAAAGYSLYSLTRKEAPTLEKSLSEQARLLGLVKDAYSDAAIKAGKFYSESKAVITLQTELNINNLQGAVKEQANKFKLGLGASTVSFDPLGNALGGNFGSEWDTKFQAFRKPIEQLQQDLRSGVPDIVRFREEVANIALADPKFRERAAELLEMSQAAQTTAEKLKLQERALRLLQGVGTAADREGLGLSKAQINAYDQLIQSTRDRIAELTLEGTAAGQTAGAVEALRLQHQAERAAKQSHVQVNQAVIDQLKEELTLRQRQRDLAQVQTEIKFGRQTALLAPEDVAIAQQLKGLYPDVAMALGSTDAVAIKAASAFSSRKPKSESEDRDERLQHSPAKAA